MGFILLCPEPFHKISKVHNAVVKARLQTCEGMSFPVECGSVLQAGTTGLHMQLSHA